MSNHSAILVFSISVVIVSFMAKVGNYIGSVSVLIIGGVAAEFFRKHGSEDSELSTTEKTSRESDMPDLGKFNQKEEKERPHATENEETLSPVVTLTPKPTEEKQPATSGPAQSCDDLVPLSCLEKNEANRRMRTILGQTRSKYSVLEMDKVLDFVLRILLSQRDENVQSDFERSTTGEMVGCLKRIDERISKKGGSPMRQRFSGLIQARNIRNRVAHTNAFDADVAVINKALQSYEDFISAAIHFGSDHPDFRGSSYLR